MDKDILKQKLLKHELFIKNIKGGKRAILSDEELCGYKFKYTNVSDASFSDANLTSSFFTSATALRTHFMGTNLTLADFSDADLRLANFTDANCDSANFEGAIMTDVTFDRANLNNVNIRWAIGNGREIKTIQTNLWTITYTVDIMAIGWEQHSLLDWFNFTDEDILSLGGKENGKQYLKFWRKWKPILTEIGVFSHLKKTEGL